MNKPKFCVDCKHYRFVPSKIIGRILYEEERLCDFRKRESDEWNMVTGEKTHSKGDAFRNFCEYMRIDPRRCGDNARFFEPRNPT